MYSTRVGISKKKIFFLLCIMSAIIIIFMRKQENFASNDMDIVDVSNKNEIRNKCDIHDDTKTNSNNQGERRKLEPSKLNRENNSGENGVNKNNNNENKSNSTKETTTDTTSKDKQSSSSKNNSQNSSSDGGYIPSICKTFTSKMAPSKGNVNMPVFVVTFSDIPVRGQMLSENQLADILYNNSNSESMSSFLYNASYGQQTVSGDVYFYKAKNRMSYYKGGESFETLAMEVLSYFDSKIDYSKYDNDGEGHIDCFTLNVLGNDDFWYGCQPTWYYNPNYTLDGVKIYNYIINDAEPVKGNEDYYVREMLHEFGHCMGLPDLYKYDTSDYENLKGAAGKAMMEDMEGDYCMFSKLSLGWLKKDNVNVYTSGTKTYTLHSAQTTGECILISRTDLKSDSPYTGEYFMIEYNTSDYNMAKYVNDGGIRIMHIEAETMPDYYGSGAFKYNNYSKHYQSHQGIQIARLVNDGKGYLTPGATINSSASNFKWYDSSQRQTIDPGINIKISQSSEKGALDVTITGK